MSVYRKFNILNYYLPRSVTDRWILGENPNVQLRDLEYQNEKDWPRMQLREFRSSAEVTRDYYTRLQYRIYPNQAIFAMVFSKIAQELFKFQAKYIDTNRINLYLLQQKAPLSCDLLPKGNIIMSKGFVVHERDQKTGEFRSPACMTIEVQLNITDFNIHFIFLCKSV